MFETAFQSAESTPLGLATRTTAVFLAVGSLSVFLFAAVRGVASGGVGDLLADPVDMLRVFFGLLVLVAVLAAIVSIPVFPLSLVAFVLIKRAKSPSFATAWGTASAVVAAAAFLLTVHESSQALTFDPLPDSFAFVITVAGVVIGLPIALCLTLRQRRTGA
jgi:hypothetical protein